MDTPNDKSIGLGLIGIGKMGGGIARRLAAGGIGCVAFDRAPERAATLARETHSRVRAASDLAGLVASLEPPRVVWLMLPAGAAVDDAVSALGDSLARGDLVVDGGNGDYRDDTRRYRALAARGIEYVDIGVSAGVAGEHAGYCLMLGGNEAAAARVVPLLEVLAPGAGRDEQDDEPSPAEKGYLHCGPVGAGHYTKMIHNGIEYGLMEAYAEGFALLRGADQPGRPPEQRYALPAADIAELWRHGSVVRSWLLDLAAAGLAARPDLENFSAAVEDSGEGRWTVREALDQGRAAEVISAALAARLRSQGSNDFADRLLSALRAGFGGHGAER